MPWSLLGVLSCSRVTENVPSRVMYMCSVLEQCSCKACVLVCSGWRPITMSICVSYSAANIVQCRHVFRDCQVSWLALKDLRG